MSKKVIIYGGAFNPPTIAHQAILRAAIRYAGTLSGEVWLLPSGENNKKKTGIDRQTRLDYLHALIDSVHCGNVPVRIELLELNANYKTDKIETVQNLEKLYPGLEFIWLYGSDSIETMDLWGGDWLRENTDMLIVARSQEFDANVLPSRAKVLEVETIGLPSSTVVRQYISANKDYRDLVPLRVYKAIRPENYR